MQESKLTAALSTLQDAGVHFILVGGLAAVLNSAPIQTYDIDLVYAREPENIDHLLNALELMDAIFRIQPGAQRISQCFLSFGSCLMRQERKRIDRAFRFGAAPAVTRFSVARRRNAETRRQVRA